MWQALNILRIGQGLSCSSLLPSDNAEEIHSMSTSMFITGFVIFSIYMALTIWNIFASNKKSKKE
jgi:hypothetical protein